MRYSTILGLAVLIGLPLGLGSQAPRVQLPEHGFSIEALPPDPNAASYTPLIMMLPATRGFSPNINVRIQQYPGSIQEYMQLTRAQMRAADFDMISESEAGESTVEFEYAGVSDGETLHWYASATQRGDRIYLVTATALQSEWERYGAALTSRVRSFQLEEPARPR